PYLFRSGEIPVSPPWTGSLTPLPPPRQVGITGCTKSISSAVSESRARLPTCSPVSNRARDPGVVDRPDLRHDPVHELVETVLVCAGPVDPVAAGTPPEGVVLAAGA